MGVLRPPIASMLLRTRHASIQDHQKQKPLTVSGEGF
jgi:hypothetical protein